MVRVGLDRSRHVECNSSKFCSKGRWTFLFLLFERGPMLDESIYCKLLTTQKGRPLHAFALFPFLEQIIDGVFDGCLVILRKLLIDMLDNSPKKEFDEFFNGFWGCSGICKMGGKCGGREELQCGM